MKAANKKQSAMREKYLECTGDVYLIVSRFPKTSSLEALDMTLIPSIFNMIKYNY